MIREAAFLLICRHLYQAQFFENNIIVKQILNTENCSSLDRSVSISNEDKTPDEITDNNSDDAMMYSKKYGWNSSEIMKTDFSSPGKAFADFIRESEDITKDRYVFYSRKSSAAVLNDLYPDLNSIVKTDENMILTSSGLAKEGKVPFVVSGGFYTAEKNQDQLRNTVCLNNFNVKFIDLYNDLSHQRRFPYPADDISAVLSIPNLCVFSPSDSAEAVKNA